MKGKLFFWVKRFCESDLLLSALRLQCLSAFWDSQSDEFWVFVNSFANPTEKLGSHLWKWAKYQNDHTVFYALFYVVLYISKMIWCNLSCCFGFHVSKHKRNHSVHLLHSLNICVKTSATETSSVLIWW